MTCNTGPSLKSSSPRRRTMAALPIPVPTPSRWVRVKGALTPAEWRRGGLLFAVILALHVVGFGMLFSLGAVGLGAGITAYTLGLRHASDAHQIAAIDNPTRKLMSEGQRPLSVGFWFSLGPSSVV